MKHALHLVADNKKFKSPLIYAADGSAYAVNDDEQAAVGPTVVPSAWLEQIQGPGEIIEMIRDPNDPGLKYLRALNIETGATVWEVPQQGPQEANYSGVLTTAGGLVFYGETGGGFAAVDAKSGKTLWTVHGNAS